MGIFLKGPYGIQSGGAQWFATRDSRSGVTNFDNFAKYFTQTFYYYVYMELFLGNINIFCNKVVFMLSN